jgi:hypothetical protein
MKHRPRSRDACISGRELFRRFYQEYPQLLPLVISDALRRKSDASTTSMPIQHAVRAESGQPGRLNPNLSWTHYREKQAESDINGHAVRDESRAAA